MADPSSEALQPQNVNLLSMLLPAGKHQAPAVNSGLPLWSNNAESGNLHPGMCGIDLAQEVHAHQNLHNSQPIGIDIQQHYSVTQNQPTVACLNSQITQPENFLSEISQDPKLLNILQHQCLPLELQLQPLMLQLRQQEQQQLKQHISQVLPHDCSTQQFYDPSCGTMHASLSSGDCLKLCIQRTQEILELAQKLPGHCMPEIQLPSHASVNLTGTEVIGFSESWVPALPLPHEMMGRAPQKDCSATFTQGFVVIDAPSGKESIADSPSKKTSSGSNEDSKVTIFEAIGFPHSFQDPAKSENVSSHISNQVHEMEISSTHPHLWKPTPGVRTKSLLEIQAEEQLKAQRETAMENSKVTVTAPSVLSIPWASLAETSEGNQENVNISRSKRSQLHELLAEEVQGMSNDKDAIIIDSADDTTFPPLAPYVTQSDAHYLDDGDFIEVKGTRKKRNKAEKSKGSAVRAPEPVDLFNLSLLSVPIEKGKPVKLAQQEKDELLPHPSAPSLGDFVPWKGDQAIPGPAWSTDPAQVRKPLSLRDIQMEEEWESGTLQQLVPASSHAKEPINQQNHGNDSSWQGSGSPPSGGNEPLQMTSHVSRHSNSNSEDDSFWGPREHAEQDKSEFQSPSQSGASAVNMISAALDIQKKGKKGKRLCSSVLGFKVHSNRIMMGEIMRAKD